MTDPERLERGPAPQMDLRDVGVPPEFTDDPILKFLAAKRNRIVRAGRTGNFNARKGARLRKVDVAAQHRINYLRAEAQKQTSTATPDGVLDQLNPNRAVYLKDGEGA